MVILCHHPDVQQKLRDEIDNFIKAHGRIPTFQERDAVPFLISAQKEIMRYRSVTSFGVLHESTEDRKLLILLKKSGNRHYQRHDTNFLHILFFNNTIQQLNVVVTLFQRALFL